MGATVLGAVAAVTASALFSVGLVWQSAEARAAGRHHRMWALLGTLVRRMRWIAGGGLMLVGFGFHTAALGLAPLTVVQPALAAGLLVLLALAAHEDGERVRGRELWAVAGIGVGLVGVTLTASERTTVSASAPALALVLGGLAAVAVAPLLHAWSGGKAGPEGPLWPALSAGTAYALTGITTKLFSDGLSTGSPGATALWLAATVAAGVLALLDQTRALQRGHTTQVGALLYVVPVVIPVLLAPVLVGEDWGSSPSGSAALALSVAAVCAGAGVLGGSRRIAAVEDGQSPGSSGGNLASAQPASSSSRR
jgi:drug/metabolite transporter (DMT)-like permease